MSSNKTEFLNEFINSDQFNEIGKKLVQCILKENLDKLAILRYTNGWSKDDQTIVEYKSIEEQCHIIKNDDVLPPVSEELVDLEDFRRDCSFIESTLQKTYDEIKSKGTYNALCDVLEIFRRLQSEEAEFLNDTQKKEDKFVELQNTYYEERKLFKEKTDKIMADIGNLKDEIKDFEAERVMKMNYLKAWQNSKTEMSQYQINNIEQKLQNVVIKNEAKCSNETGINVEIKKIFYQIDLDIQNQIIQWKQKYQTDITDFKNKIEKLRSAKEEQQEKTAQMIRTYIKRQQEIDKYNEYKVDQQKKGFEKDRKNKAAIKIQAWWRGTMVRKGFGKYKKKKDKKLKNKLSLEHQKSVVM